MTDLDAPIMQWAFSISQRKRKSDLHQSAKLDDLARS